MSSILTKLRLLKSSRAATEVVTKPSYKISEVETRVDMAMAPSELPSDNVFDMPSNDSHVSSSDNDTSGLVPSSLSARAERDEWLGEKYLNYAIAHMLVRHTSSSGGSTSLNVNFTRALEHFDYEHIHKVLLDSEVSTYSWLRAAPLQEPGEMRKAALIWTGALIRQGDQRDRRALDQAVIQSSNRYRPEASSTTENIARQVDTLVPGDHEQPAEQLSPANAPDDTWRYTKILQERFLGGDAVPIYREFVVRAYPPLFGSEVKFEGKMYTGQAGNKKLAKHRASKLLSQKPTSPIFLQGDKTITKRRMKRLKSKMIIAKTMDLEGQLEIL